MLEAIAARQRDPAVRSVLFRGAGGKSFISGTDIGHFRDFRDGQQGIAYEAFVERVIDAVERIAVPTVAVIDGWAVGGGLALATACDFRVCSEGARFGAPIARTLSNDLVVAQHRAAAGCAGCAACEAHAAAGGVPEGAQALAGRRMALSPVTHKAVKESMRRIVVEQRLDDADIVAEVYGSQAFRDGVAGFNSDWRAGRSRPTWRDRAAGWYTSFNAESRWYTTLTVCIPVCGTCLRFGGKNEWPL